ncbi:MAG TPA: LON peptidase substrate-binding domain-containing protein [Dongiaceae bacterium]|nr:LON peptidase substrate-binding domain-containing protein [Dongiaceae bacterium]
MQPDRIPLFPLNVVLLPGEQLPLHIFEPRYRRMVHECLEKGSPFGMLLALKDGVVHVGCTAEIELVTKRYDDGRMDILSIGKQPFRVVELFQDDPLLEGTVDHLEDKDAPVSERTTQELMSLYETCYTLVFSGMPQQIDCALSGSVSFSIAATLPIDLMWKQRILELRSEQERQERLARYLREWALHLQKVGVLRARSAGNGQGLN